MANPNGPILGLHHMTAICADAQTNVDFYAGVLGLKVTKITVNFDDPGAYHLYYGDGGGSPGTSLTFFPYPGGHYAKPGPGQVAKTSLAIPADSLGFWRARLTKEKVAFENNGENGVVFQDREGLALELLASETYDLRAPFERSAVPVEHQISSMAEITLAERTLAPTTNLLMDLMAMKMLADDLFEMPDGTRVRIMIEETTSTSRGGPGSVHHIAYRTADDPTQAILHKALLAEGFNASPIIDRTYFHSVYFREPGGVLFEIATDGPGFDVDEKELGSGLRLPPQYEPYRDQIVQALPPIRLPDGTVIGG